MLVGRFGDDRDDPPLPEVAADRARGVGLVGAHPLGTCPGMTGARPGDVQVRHQVREHRRVPSLAGPDEHDQRIAVPVNELVDLRRQPAAGPADRMIGRLGQQIPVVRSCPLCPV